MRRLARLLAGGLAATEALWPPIRRAYGWVHRLARLLEPLPGGDGATIQRAVGELIAEMTAQQAEAGPLAPGIAHFLKVTRSYWPGLFHCYDVAGLPRTNNGLEQLFGSMRYRERRATGRPHGSAGLVVRGAVRVLAAVATPAAGWKPDALRPRNLEAWRTLRAELEQRHAARRAQRRFRRDPTAYLAAIEATLLK